MSMTGAASILAGDNASDWRRTMREWLRRLTTKLDPHGDAAKLDAIRGLLADTDRSAQEKVNRIAEIVGMGPSGP